MKKTLALLFLFAACNIAAYSQEICDNAIDDDGDGFIDLNDDECDCDGLGGVVDDIIPNPSFEERSCCPSSYSQLYCVDDWSQASEATSDYFNTCGSFTSYPHGDAPVFPLPGSPGGEGFAGFILWRDWPPVDTAYSYYSEYVGLNTLLSPLAAGTTYTLSLYTARSSGDVDLEFSLFGSPDAADMPWVGYECPTGEDSWELLASQHITYDLDGSWQIVSLVFTPTVDINAIAFGGACDPVEFADLSYYYIDEISLSDNGGYTYILETGNLCAGNSVLTAYTDTTEGDWQWYEDGIALIGETDVVLDVNVYGPGSYSVIHSFDTVCERLDRVVELEVSFPEITCTVDIETLGSDGSIDITVTGEAPPFIYDWDIDGTGDFDDEEDLDDLVAGTYILEVKDSNGCVARKTILVGNLLSIEEQDISGLSIYPNPANDHVMIDLNGTYAYQLTAINGDLVLEGKATDQKRVSLTHLASGIYFLSIENEQGVETIKLVKQP